MEAEHVLGILQEAVRHQDRAELPHLVPEDPVVPVLHVEVVVLDVRVDRASKRHEIGECLAIGVGRKQGARTRR